MAKQDVTQIEMMKIIALFRQDGYKGEYESFQRVSGTDREFFVVMSNEQGIKALFRASLMLNAVEFQYVLDDKHVFVTGEV
ncbi:hypothetical protein CT113_10675 [Levilactobacillus brevis]|uniref:hypothetical protein n=1 Tax=Levilactobacillus brevis TaxID=1580 RepID=UPI0004132B5A|nr:hypothetical protein [Levilactobacillus brevis]ARN93428.1 hypothetical protein AZI11_11265 [Levilactobacillus brevis]ARN96028.1 hypothetical protein AZI12_11300 [Levilactobacillus brevis]ATU70763.1 hypothetical protein CT113_10675 [Levilactobacillus brevis]